MARKIFSPLLIFSVTALWAAAAFAAGPPSVPAVAAAPAAGSKPGADRSTSIDFEGDVIEHSGRNPADQVNMVSTARRRDRLIKAGADRLKLDIQENLRQSVRDLGDTQ